MTARWQDFGPCPVDNKLPFMFSLKSLPTIKDLFFFSKISSYVHQREPLFVFSDESRSDTLIFALTQLGILSDYSEGPVPGPIQELSVGHDVCDP